jgi:hypothetical protein
MYGVLFKAKISLPFTNLTYKHLYYCVRFIYFQPPPNER